MFGANIASKYKKKYAQTGLCKGAVWNEFREQHQIHYQTIEKSTIFNAQLEPFFSANKKQI
jgi:hypothetical protein